MKKLFFGLLAIVLFSSLSYGKSKIYPLKITNDIENLKKNENVNVVGLGCLYVTVSVSYAGVGVGVSGWFCCWRTSAHEHKYDCGIFNNHPRPAPFVMCFDIETLDKTLLDEINKGKSNEISISNSHIVENEGRFYKVLDGSYAIEKDQDGRFLKVSMIEVEK